MPETDANDEPVGTVFEVTVAHNLVESIRRVADRGFNPDWSPDGTRLVVAEEDTGAPYGRAIVSRLFLVDLAI